MEGITMTFVNRFALGWDDMLRRCKKKVVSGNN
jgi:hypothetical protein